MASFESWVKPTDPFSEKCIYAYKIKYMDVESISVYCKGIQLCSNTCFKILKKQKVCNVVTYVLIY
jgi:hypothetical protein